MAPAVNVAPISICIDNDKAKPSVKVSGHANRSNITEVVDVLDQVTNTDKCCVSLHLGDLESIDHIAIQHLAISAGVLKSSRRRLHLESASEAVIELLNRLQLTEIFCNHSECLYPCSPECCCHAAKSWEMDVFTFPSDLGRCREARERIDRVAESVGFNKNKRGDVSLAVGEAVTNAIKYGSRDQQDAMVTVTCIATSEKIRVTIHDNGPGFDLNNIPSFEDALFAESGRGVHCINAVMDEVSFDFTSGTTVRMTKFSG